MLLANATNFANANSDGNANYNSASNVNGVRPLLIGAHRLYAECHWQGMSVYPSER